MTHAGRYSDPEMSCERKGAKRYRAAIHKLGECCACIHRDTENTYWGRTICRYGQNRLFPQCKTDGKAQQFEVDGDAVTRIMEGMKHAA